MLVRRASDAWRLLNGVCSLCKPSEITIDRLTKVLIDNLARELNQMDDTPLKLYHRPVFREDPITAELRVVDHVTQIDYSDHPLVIGRRYLPIDFQVQCIQNLEYFTSGVCIFGINDGCDQLVPKIKKARFLHAYHVTGLLGRATLDQTVRSKIVEKATYGHVTKSRMDTVLAKFEAENAKAAFNFAGVDMQSQKAFELASRGLVRPREDSSAIFYRLKCLQLRRPFFTLEVQCINESDNCLKTLIHEIGLSMKTVASCVSIKKVRDGPFDLDHCLLEKHWTLENIINNIDTCQQVMECVKYNQTLSNAKRRLPVDVDTIASDDDTSIEETEFVNCVRKSSYDRLELEDDFSGDRLSKHKRCRLRLKARQ
ncbi:hypothetical protein M513_10452 [Trichuris suis]|uniref:Pseudouridine synthase II N-terminal domain-containing protein n=1 Tax=Trichuris suis TaxID=68888 RepID=A0A085LUM2_9BILA|nr:hypothetical protein M513_10452 [Trichuris suis]